MQFDGHRLTVSCSLQENSFSFQEGLSGLEITADIKLLPLIFLKIPSFSLNEVEFRWKDFSRTDVSNNESFL